MRRLFLLRHASTDAVRAAAFGSDEPLDAHGRADAAAVRLPVAGEVLVSPARRTAETAALAGLDGAVTVPALAEADFGRWAGSTLADVHGTEPEAVLAWMSDPAAAPHGGESLAQLLARVGGWLGEQAALEGSALAVTHGGVVKAAVCHALHAPPAAFWRLDVAPLSLTELTAHDGRWTVARVNERLTGAAARRRGEPKPEERDAAAGPPAARTDRPDPPAGSRIAAPRGGPGASVAPSERSPA